ncbi:MAG: endonuclease III [Bacteroidales bacterium]|nr:endonuclease III [Bacteroidales bacterium]
MTKKERFTRVIEYFTDTMPEPETELTHQNPYELIVAVILSAQCTDKRVNMITPDFFKVFPTPEKLADAGQEEVFALIKSCSYPNNKAKHLIGMAKTLIHEFGGNIPDSVEQLQMLPGVGRKTANVVAAVIYNMPVMPVDTHVFRVASRIGLTNQAKTPLQAELQLTENFPEELISKAHHWLILHGRYTCIARKPKCEECGLTGICKYYKKQNG